MTKSISNSLIFMMEASKQEDSTEVIAALGTLLVPLHVSSGWLPQDSVCLLVWCLGIKWIWEYPKLPDVLSY